VTDIIEVLDSLAPRSLAEDWDNVGLQVGDLRRTVKNIWIALDPTYAVVKAACRQKVDLIVTHHPLLFKPLKNINLGSPAGSIIDLAVRHQVAIFAAHTNLDSAPGGINDILADRIGLCDLKPLTASRERQRFKAVIYAPRGVEQQITRALFLSQSENGPRIAGCFSAIPVNGMAANSDTGKISPTDQSRIEIEVGPDELETLTADLAVFQPDHQIRYDIYPLIVPDQKTGIGRVGSLESALDLKSLARMIKKKLKLKHLKYTGNPALSVKKIAICSGSGASLLSSFFASGAQVFVSGDLRYHDARDVEAANLGLIDIGHFASEHLIVKELTARLRSVFAKFRMNVTVKACDIEKDPFTVL